MGQASHRSNGHGAACYCDKLEVFNLRRFPCAPGCASCLHKLTSGLLARALTFAPSRPAAPCASGNTEFMKEDNSFLIPVEGLEPVRDGPFQGHLWASPSVQGYVWRGYPLLTVFHCQGNCERVAEGND